MILGSHNSWSYLPLTKWWMKPFAFMAKCQDYNIRQQYELCGVRCFDLRIKFNKDGNLVIAHGNATYKYTRLDLEKDLYYLSNKGDCYVRVLHEIRNKKEHTDAAIEDFGNYCKYLEDTYRHIKFWCGRNLADWSMDYIFWHNPTCEELYSSVCPPKLIDDWYPKLYAKLNNKKNLAKGTDKDIMLIDFVNIK